MCAFVRLGELLATHADLARKVDVLEQEYEGRCRVVFDAIRLLMALGMAGAKNWTGF